MASLLIRGGFVVDGTGADGAVGDVAVREGRIVSDDEIEPGAAQLDATGLVVAPGFVDLHTHYDAQLSWDAAATPSTLHGVTTVFGGNCGFTLAPAGAEHAPYLMRMMARVEGMPLEALEEGLAWDWKSFADWFERHERAIGVNAGFLVGHSAVRRSVLGEGCHGPATADQIAAMAQLVTAACRAGAMGFSTSTAPTHNDGDGEPVPSRAASPQEMIALAGAIREVPGTTLEAILAGCISGFSDDERDLLLAVSTLNPTGHESQLAASDHAAERGGRVVALTLPHTMRIRLSFLSGFVLDGFPGWREVLSKPVPERIALLRDPDVRRRLDAQANSEEAGLLRGLANWRSLEVIEAFAPELRHLEGKTIGEIVDLQGDGADPFDVLLDIVAADELRTGLRPSGLRDSRADWELRAQVWRDPRAVIGGSDAGAHLDMMCGAIYSTAVLAQGVREYQVLNLEEAIHRLTDVPARLYGLRERGRIAPGCAADLVLFDADTVGYEPERMRYDLPGGAWRLHAEATGVHRVLVNGVTVVSDGAVTGATPGTLLRSGRDTETVVP
jgi:N-acyl-D-aspartate/D-glutamate deacylase